MGVAFIILSMKWQFTKYTPLDIQYTLCAEFAYFQLLKCHSEYKVWHMQLISSRVLVCMWLCCLQEVTEEELRQRREVWEVPAKRQKVGGLLAKYRKLVSSAHTGAITLA